MAALRVLGVGPGKTVVVPALTFPAPAAAAAWLGAQVRLCDVEQDTMNLSARTLSPCLDDSVALVIAIDQFGNPAPYDELEPLLAARGIPLVVDAACSLGSAWQGRPCGGFGLMSTMSFHPRKVVSTGEGGAILTDDDELAASVRRERNHGLESGAFVLPALNLRMGEVPAAIGLKQLAKLESIVAQRRALSQRYLGALSIEVQVELKSAVSNRQTLAAALPAHIDRRRFVQAMASHGVEVGPLSYCCTDLPSLAAHLAKDQAATPVARDLASRGVALPLYPQMTVDEVDTVVRLVQNLSYVESAP
jgi:perosamine synthetase